MYQHFIKRFLDVALCLFALIFLAPLFVVLAALVQLSSPGGVFFRQKRVGKNKRHFYMLKFRTMRTDTPKDCPTHLLENPEQYITPIGKFLRKTSLDELPQIINILRGDMTLIGPRPALWNQFDLIAERDKYGANSVEMGITGLAQINGRDELPIPIKAKYDGIYARKISFLFDLRIFFITIFKILKSDGVQEGKQDEKNSSAGRK